MPKRICITCSDLYDMDTTPGQRCPTCQAKATRRRQARAPRAQRGYGKEHDQLRAKLIAAFKPGQPCARCGKPITSSKDAQLGHDDHDRTRYRGLEHVRCNEATAGRRKR